MESHRKKLEIKRLIVHENFNILNLENDIALIELDMPLNLEESDYVKNICLPEGTELKIQK